MAAEAPIYDLLLLLSLDTAEEQRAKVLSDAEKAITGAGGSLERTDHWGRRPMAYQIRHQADAEYHLLQFTAPGELIAELSHTLGIADGVLRHRIIKVRPGTPAAPSSPPPVVVTAGAPAGPPSVPDEPGPRPAPEEDAAAVAATAAEPADEDVETGE